MQIATFNVNSIHARLAFVKHWLEARAPDIACLQELKVTDDKFPTEELAALGYHAVIHGQPQWNGVAIVSKEPMEVVQTGLPGAEDQGARLVTARLPPAAGRPAIEVTSVYVPNGKSVDHDDYRQKLDFLAALDDYLGTRLPSDDVVVVGGDFNLCHRALDSHAPDRLAGRIFHTDAERRALDRLLARGLTDLYRHDQPEGTMFSWWDYRAGAFHKNHGLRIDLLLGNPAATAALESTLIDREYRKKKDGETASDHAPVTATLRLG